MTTAMQDRIESAKESLKAFVEDDGVTWTSDPFAFMDKLANDCVPVHAHEIFIELVEFNLGWAEPHENIGASSPAQLGQDVLREYCYDQLREYYQQLVDEQSQERYCPDCACEVPTSPNKEGVPVCDCCGRYLSEVEGD